MFIRVLGRVGFGTDSGSMVAVTGRVTATVLAHLATAGGRSLTTEALIEAVWDSPTPTSRNAVQVAMTKLRRSLGPHCIVADRAGYALRSDLVRVDWSEVIEAERSARDLCHQGAYQRALPAVDRAIALFVDEPLAGLDSAASFILRERAERVFNALTVLRARCLLAAGRAEQAVEPLQQQLARDQFDESAAALLIEALARIGRTADAVSVFHDLGRRLGDELGVRPSGGTVAIFNQVLTESLPPVTIASDLVGALPAPASPTFGRDAEVSLISALCDQGHRLITIVGAGGLGKSTLAVVAARKIADDGRQPAVMVDLTLCARGEDVATVATNALDPEAIGLNAALEGVAPIVILDNAEHVATAAGDFAHRLLAVPGVQVLVTSRRPLGLKDERLFDLEPLVGVGEGNAALALLLDRVGLGANQTDADLRELQRVAARADGVPLVLELFAAALRWRSPVDLVADLDDRIPIGVGRDAPDREARHRNVAAVVDWSLGQLDAKVASALAALTVIRGKFDERAAAAVIQPAADLSITTVLASVLDVSLLQRVRQPGRVSFRMLEPVRQGIRASALVQVSDAAHDAHARYFLNQIQRADDLSADQANSYRGLSEWDQGNVLPALSWLWEHDRPAAMERLPSLINYWEPNIIDDETYFRWVDSALATRTVPERDRWRVAIARFEALVFYRNERPDEVAALRTIVARSAGSLERRWKYRLNSAESGWARAHGDLATAIALLEETDPNGARDRILKDARIAECHWYAGNHRRASDSLEQVSSRLEQLRDYGLGRSVLSMRMFIALEDSDTSSAQVHCSDLDRLIRAEGDESDLPYSLLHRAWLDLDCERFTEVLDTTSQVLDNQDWLLVPVRLLEVVMLTAFALRGVGAQDLAAPAAAVAGRLGVYHIGILHPYALHKLQRLSAYPSSPPHAAFADDLGAAELMRTLIAAGRVRPPTPAGERRADRQHHQEAADQQS